MSTSHRLIHLSIPLVFLLFVWYAFDSDPLMKSRSTTYGPVIRIFVTGVWLFFAHQRIKKNWKKDSSWMFILYLVIPLIALTIVYQEKVFEIGYSLFVVCYIPALFAATTLKQNHFFTWIKAFLTVFLVDFFCVIFGFYGPVRFHI